MENDGELKCRSCGRTASQFKRTMFLGCPDCYNTLKEVVLPFIAEQQGCMKHIGKVAPACENPQISVLRKEYRLAMERKRLDDAERIAQNIRALGGRP